jgi:hypothetical protein
LNNAALGAEISKEVCKQKWKQNIDLQKL